MRNVTVPPLAPSSVVIASRSVEAFCGWALASSPNGIQPEGRRPTATGTRSKGPLGAARRPLQSRQNRPVICRRACRWADRARRESGGRVKVCHAPSVGLHTLRHCFVISPAVAARGTAKSGFRRLVPHRYLTLQRHVWQGRDQALSSSLLSFGLTCLTCLIHRNRLRPAPIHDRGEITFATHMLAAGVPLHKVSEHLGTPPTRSPGTCTATPPTRACPLPSSGSPQQWAGKNVCRCYTNGYTAAKRPPQMFSETASDLLLPVGMTGFEPAAP